MSTETAPDKYSPNWMDGLDGRTAVAQELRARHRTLCNDLGGLDSLSYQQRALVDRALFLELHLQQEEMRLAEGGAFDSGKWVQACNSLAGLFGKLGMDRQAKEVPDLKTFMQRRETGE